MNHLNRVFVLTLTGIVLAGCGNLQRQSRTFDTQGSHGITIDASQRAIYTVSKKFPGGVGWQAFCAEPSPDALSALASSFGLDASVASKAIGLAINNQDSTASIGLRTQTIQLLRDAMYRLCEGYASGALDRTGFTRLQRRYQHIMLSLLAIEQLTGPVVAQQVALTGSSSATLGKGLGEIGKMLAEGAADLAAADQAVTDAQALEKSLSDSVASPAAGSTEAQKAELQKQHAAAKKDTVAKTAKAKAAKTYYESLETRLKDAQRMVLQATSSAQGFVPAGAMADGATSNIAVVAGHVTDIVKTLIEHDYTRDVCMDVLLSGDADEINAATFAVVAPMCAWAFKMPLDVAKKFQESADARVETIKRNSQRPPVEPQSQPPTKK